ncbi:MAG TPA: SDR family NAD(P)-dependent oxidoreductase [Gemmataceae bacterium]|nr:SDR family NAD(P)-dependent oxidoreductase [Gemmataceae bacterium]
MPNAFTGQVTIVTGASSGIGWEVARELASQGAKVGLLSRRKEKLAELAEDIRQQGGTVAWAAADVGNREETTAGIQEIKNQLGPIDLLIANAGVGAPTLLNPMNVADVEKMVRVNLLGVVYGIAAVLPEMLQRRRGHLATVSSLAAYKGMPGESGYCCSKAAVNSFMEGLRIHLRDRGIAVTTICPGFIRTPMTAVNQFPMPWLMNADEAARRIVRALVRRRKVYNFPWQTTFLMKMTRWLPDWILARTMHSYNENPPISSIH